MDSTERDALAAECRTFSLYLMNHTPGPYVVEKYCAAHAAGNILHTTEHDALDPALMRLARRNGVLLRAVDLYTSLFFKHALVRKKLVLLLAILESTADTHPYFDSTDALGTVGFCVQAVRRGVVCGALLLVSLVAILPVHFGLRASGERAVRRARSNGRYAPRA